MTKPAQRKSMMQAFLATALAGGLLGIAAWQQYHGALDGDVKQTILTLATVGFTFFLGSSKGSQDKTDVLTNPPEEEPVP